MIVQIMQQYLATRTEDSRQIVLSISVQMEIAYLNYCMWRCKHSCLRYLTVLPFHLPLVVFPEGRLE